jgi:hypothetical protein
MSTMTQTIMAPWRNSTILTAYNVAFSAAGLPTLDTVYGIQAHEVLLADIAVTKLPAMSAHPIERRRSDYYTCQNLNIRWVVRVRLAFCDVSPVDIWDLGGTYCDCIRAVATTQFQSSLALFKWLADDPVGDLYRPDEHLSTRTVTTDFEFVVPQLGTTA